MSISSLELPLDMELQSRLIGVVHKTAEVLYRTWARAKYLLSMSAFFADSSLKQTSEGLKQSNNLKQDNTNLNQISKSLNQSRSVSEETKSSFKLTKNSLKLALLR